MVRPHQPRHHLVPHTRSNQLHRGDPPYRPGPPPRTPDPRPHRPFTRLNTTHDFDESLVALGLDDVRPYPQRDASVHRPAAFADLRAGVPDVAVVSQDRRPL